MKERIKQLLINGLTQSEVATTVGCSPAYVSQLMASEGFKESVIAEMTKVQEVRTEDEHIEARMGTLEHRIITAMTDKLQEATLGEMTRALEVVHKRQDNRWSRKNPQLNANGQPVNINIVSLALPAHIAIAHAPTVQLNSENEVVAIDNKALAPMSSDGVKNLFAQINGARTQAQLDNVVDADAHLVETL